jgi:thiol-disulfide isomerase/thioredoxin
VGLVTLVTRDGCSLCDEAAPLVARLAAEAEVPLEVRDVDADPGLREWSDHVPVVLLDGVEHARWWVEEKALRKALRGRV